MTLVALNVPHISRAMSHPTSSSMVTMSTWPCWHLAIYLLQLDALQNIIFDADEFEMSFWKIMVKINQLISIHVCRVEYEHTWSKKDYLFFILNRHTWNCASSISNISHFLPLSNILTPAVYLSPRGYSVRVSPSAPQNNIIGWNNEEEWSVIRGVGLAAIAEVPSKPTVNRVKGSKQHYQNIHHQSKKFNLVLFGIPEQSHGTAHQNRILLDWKTVSSIVNNHSTSMSSLPISIQDCVRLGSYCQNHTGSRPLLVMLNSISDVTYILSRNGKLHGSKGSPSTFKEIYSKKNAPNTRPCCQKKDYLNSKSIKISGNKLFVDSKLYSYLCQWQLFHSFHHQCWWSNYTCKFNCPSKFYCNS